MKTKIKLLVIKIFEKMKLRETKVESPVRLNPKNILRFHSISVLTNLAVENIGINNIKNYWLAEAGIGYGETFSFLSRIASILDTKLIGFDSFKGFPEPSSEKDQRAWGGKTKAGQWNVNDEVSINNKVNRTNGDDKIASTYTELVSGFFEESLKTYEPEKQFFFVHLDVDLYSSYSTCLPYFYDRLAVGGIIGFDEYNDLKWYGAKIAIDEFCEERDIVLKIEPVTGRGYIIKVI
jgi:O-methyltransferase